MLLGVDAVDAAVTLDSLAMEVVLAEGTVVESAGRVFAVVLTAETVLVAVAGGSALISGQLNITAGTSTSGKSMKHPLKVY